MKAIIFCVNMKFGKQVREKRANDLHSLIFGA